jgi:hypothetical protein
MYSKAKRARGYPPNYPSASYAEKSLQTINVNNVKPTFPYETFPSLVEVL